MFDPFEKPNVPSRDEYLISANVLIERAERHVALFPSAEATPLIRDMARVMAGIVNEIQFDDFEVARKMRRKKPTQPEATRAAAELRQREMLRKQRGY